MDKQAIGNVEFYAIEDDFEHLNIISSNVIGAAIEVHKHLGPGLLESAYEECLAFELNERRVKFERQVPLSIDYKTSKVRIAYRLDFLIENSVILELKTVEKLLPVHEAQLLTYLRLSNARLGLLMNFNVSVLKQGIKRLAL